MSNDSLQHDHDPLERGDCGAPADGDAPAESSCAADALRRAKAELDKARDFYDDVRHRAAERIAAVRKTTVGELADGALEFVKRHPGAGLCIAAAAGFFLGRRLRR
ncbi:MAG: hypothetical protein ABSG86_05995 [Thermoguttaceae bacterium]